MGSETAARVIEMLYRDKTLGHAGFGARLLARLLHELGGRRHADLDLLSMSPHLRRDIGMVDVPADRQPLEIWRK